MPTPHHVRRVEVVAPAVVDRPLIDAPCRTGDLCDRFERATTANRIERVTFAERFEPATFAERLREQNIAIRRAAAEAETLDRFAPDQAEPTRSSRPDRRREIALVPAPSVELPEIDKPIYREVIDRRVEVVDVLSRGNLIDILA